MGDVKKETTKTEVKKETPKKEETSAAKRIIELEKENAVLKEKLALMSEHIEKVDPEVLLKYNGKRADFVFRGFDFSKGTCKMLRSEARKLIEHDPICFSLA